MSAWPTTTCSSTALERRLKATRQTHPGDRQSGCLSPSFLPAHSLHVEKASSMSLIKAAARNPRTPFSSCASGFLRNTRPRIFPRCNGTTLSSESFPKPVSGFVHGLHGKRLQHIGHHAITRAIRIILHLLHTSPEYSVNSDLHLPLNPSLKTVSPVFVALESSPPYLPVQAARLSPLQRCFEILSS